MRDRMTVIAHTGSIMAAVEGLARAARRDGDDDREDRAYDRVMALVNDLAQQHVGGVALLTEVRKRSGRPFGGHAPYDLAKRIERFLDDGVYEPHPDAGGQ